MRIIISILLLAGSASAEPPAESLQALIQHAYKNSPEIKAARARWQAAIERYPQATSLPDPMLAYGYFASSVETRVGPQRHRIGLKQTLPWPGKRKLKGDIVRSDIEIARLRYEAAVRDVIVALKVAVSELQYLNAAVRLTQQQQRLLAETEKLATNEYAENKATLQDLLRAQSQSAQLTYDLINLSEQTEAQVTRINALLDRDPEAALELNGAAIDSRVTSPIETLYEQALQNRQEILLARQLEQRSDRAVKLAEKQSRPDVTLDLLYIETGSALNTQQDDGKDPVIIGMAINVPIWGSRNRARVHEAMHGRRAAAFSTRALENRTRAGIKVTWLKLENARRLIVLYRDRLIPHARKSTELAETLTRDTGSTLKQYLETQSIWLNFNLAYQRALADRAIHHAKLEQLTGGTVK